MKRNLVVFLVLCMVLLFGGCFYHNNSEYHAGQKMDVITNGPMGIKDSWFYYSDSIPNYDDTDNHIFWKYNLVSGEKIEIGTIENIAYGTATYAFLEQNKIFSTYGTRTDGVSVVAHCMIDGEENKIYVLSEDNFFPPLVETHPVNHTQYVEYQPESISDGGYKYHIRIGDVDGNVREIITKERSAPGVGDTVVSVSIYADTIHTFEYSDGQGYICSYDLNGNELSRESNDIVNAFLATPDEYTGSPETLWSMQVINGYYFFSTMNGKNLVLRNVEGSYSKVDWLSDANICLVKNSSTPVDEDAGKIILHDYNANRLISFDTNNNKRSEVFLENASEISYLTTDGKSLVFQRAGEWYFIKDLFVE